MLKKIQNHQRHFYVNATAVVKCALENNARVPNPEGHGLSISDDRTLKVQWMLLPPAPEDYLQLINCGCQKSKCETQTVPICVLGKNVGTVYVDSAW